MHAMNPGMIIYRLETSGHWKHKNPRKYYMIEVFPVPVKILLGIDQTFPPSLSYLAYINNNNNSNNNNNIADNNNTLKH